MKRLVQTSRVGINHHGNRGGRASARHIFLRIWKFFSFILPWLAQDLYKDLLRVNTYSNNCSCQKIKVSSVLVQFFCAMIYKSKTYFKTMGKLNLNSGNNATLPNYIH